MQIRYIECFYKVRHGEEIPKLAYPHVAFAGRSNVGKSSLINALLQRRKLAEVSKTPGKTRILQFFFINRQFLLVDLPGFGYAQVHREMGKKLSRLLTQYLQVDPPPCHLFLLLDGKRQPEAEEANLRDLACQRSIPFTLVLTKMDRLNQKATHQALARLGSLQGWEEVPKVITSARKGKGIDTLWKIIKSSLKE